MSIHDVRHKPPAAPAGEEAASTGRLSPTLSASVHVSGAWTIVTIAGEMDIQLLPLVRGLVSADARHLVFDLRQVTFMDACGLDLMLRSQCDALRADGCVRLVAPGRKVRRVLALTGLDREFATFASIDEAVSAPVPAPCGRGGPASWPTGPAGRADPVGRTY